MLLEILAIADWIMNAHATQKRSETQKYADLEQKLFAFANQMDCGDLIFFDEEDGDYYPTRKHDEECEHRAFIEEFEEESFWGELAKKLATRDLLKTGFDGRIGCNAD